MRYESEQQIFDTVVAHLRVQGEKATNSMGLSRYRTEGGLKCAVGALIPNEYYSPDMEGGAVSHLMSKPDFVPMFRELGLLQHRQLLSALQCVHDSGPLPMWEEKFHHVAQVFDLDYTPPDAT